MNDNTAQSTSRRWHVAPWPPLAWLETAIKAVALVIGFVALVGALSRGAFALPAGLRLGQLVVLGILSLGLVAAIFDRLLERELVAMIFVVVNNLGHWGMVLALASEPGPGPLLVAFCALMLIGDLVKLLFLKVHDFQVRNTPRVVLFGLTAVYGAGYTIILILELLR
jgi:hypothetical protein